MSYGSNSVPAARAASGEERASRPLFRRLSFQGRVSIGLSLATAIFAIAYIHATKALPTPQLVDPVGPKAFPYLLGTTLLLCAAGLFVEGLVLFRDEGVSPSKPVALSDPRHLVVTGVMLWTLAYFLTFGLLGYVLSTTLFLLALIYVFDGRRPFRSAAIAIGFSVASYFVFNDLMEVFLPVGSLFK